MPPLRNYTDQYNALTDPAERDFVKQRRGLVEDEKILTDLQLFREKRAAEAPPPEPKPALDPHFESWLNEARSLNPDYSDDQLKGIYERTFAEKDSDLLSFEDFREKAKPLNPDYSDADLRKVWEEQYASRGALETNPGFGGTLVEGFKQTGRSIKAFGQALANDTAGAEETAAASTSAPRDPALVRLLRDINRRKDALGPNASWFDAGSEVGKALLNDPKGAALLLTEQLPNSLAALGTAGAGAVAGSAFGPAGTVIGGLAGLFLADVALETGGKVIEKAEGGLTPIERMDALDEGLKKGAVVAGIDAATFGATKWLTGAASRAMERATVRTLESEGVDVTDKTAVELARQKPEIVDKVQAAQKEALQGVNSLGQKAARGTSEVALQTIGEGAGEYIGELVATGHGDKVEAFVEAFAGLGQSVAEIGIAKTMDSKKAVTELFGSGSEVAKPEIQDVLKQPDVDSAINAAGDAIDGDTTVTPEKIDAFLGQAVTKPTDYTDSHYSADQVTANKLFETMKSKGQAVSQRADGIHMFRGVSSKVLRPDELPDERGAAGFVTKGQYEAIEVALQAMGKHLIVLDSPLGQFEGLAYREHFPSTVFMSNKTVHDPTAVAFHEAAHLMQGQPLYEAFQQTVQENLRPGWKQAASRHKTAARRGELALLDEVSADIMGDAMMKPEFMEKVYKNLTLQVGPEAAQQEAIGFLDKLKDMIKRVHNAILGHTFQTKNGRDAANAYVRNLEAVHDSLAVAVAAEFKKNGIQVDPAKDLAIDLNARPATPVATIPTTIKEVKSGENVKEKEGQVIVPTATVDDAARDVNPEPTDPQKDAGNYKKGHVKISGLDISIETPEGGTRRGVDRSGKEWTMQMKSHYGYIRGTKGKDKDHVDVFVKPKTAPDYDGIAYVVDQIVPETKRFDEHKVILGADSVEDAKQIYQKNYSKDWKGLGAISPMPMDRLKEWLKGDTTTPVAYKEKKDLVPVTKKKDMGLVKPQTEIIEPAKDTPIGENAAGDKLYERNDGSVYRVRADRPTKTIDFGGDLAPTHTDVKDKGLLNNPLPKEEKAPAITTTRQLDEISSDIINREGELAEQGLDVTKMYNPLDSLDDVLRKRKGYTAMPEDLAKLYLERDAAQRKNPSFSPSRVIPAVPFTVAEPGKLDSIIRTIQDKNVDIKRMVEAIRQAGGQVPTELNPVLKEEMYQKRAEIRSEDYKNQELLPLIEEMRKNHVTLEHLNQYAHARHVIEDKVNARLKDLNPNMPNNDALSGLSDAEAKKILAGYTGPRKAMMQQLMTRIDAMVEKTRDLMVDYGLDRADVIAQWRQQYAAYVPLRREAYEDEGHPTGTGRSVRGASSTDRLGSNLKVSNILANIAQARDQVITRGEKMRPVVAMAGLLMLHPNKEIAVLDKPAQIKMTDPNTGLEINVPGDLANYRMPKIRRLDPKTGEVKWYPDPTFKGHENVVNFRVKGVDYAIVFNHKNVRAMEMAKAFRDIDTGQMTGILKAVAPYTRYLASINTQYNPIFGIVNFVRDAQFAMLTLSSTPLAGKQIEVLNNARKSLTGIFQDARDSRHGLPPSSATAHLWERFQHVGGPTGYRDLFFTATDRANEIERLLNPNSWKHIKSPQDLGRRMEETFLFRLLSDYNLMMENSIRLGVFKTAVEMGIDDLQAASYAKNVTVNFNKKGQVGAQMGALYAFFNANVQGTARIMETLFVRDKKGGVSISPAGKKIIAGGLLVGILQTSLLALAGFDDDEPPDFVKEKNFVIPSPGTEKGYLMMPMPLGFNLLPNVGRLASEASFALAQGKEPKIFKRGADLFHTVLSALSPTGGTGSAALELSPTLADPLLSLEMNKDWTGKKISQEDFSSLKPTPGHTRARPNATPWAISLSKMINWATGGTDYTPGVASPTPDAIDYLIQQATGGVGREISKVAQVASAAQSGETIAPYKYPLFGRFLGTATGDAATRDKFYDNIRAINLAAEEVKGRALHHEERAEFIKDHPEAAFEKAAVQMQRAIGELQDAKRLAIDRGDPKDAIKLREERISGLMRQFNEAVERRKKDLK